MQLTSFGFLLFAALLLVVYYLIPKKGQWMLLLAASYCFYLWAGIEYLGFILLTTASTYGATMAMAAHQKKHAKFLEENKEMLTRENRKSIKVALKRVTRIYLISCLVLNFGILAVCKALLIAPFKTMAEGSMLSFLSLGLPMGISFYMFQSMGYLIDVYRQTAEAEKNPLKLALFVSFFPQLIQGPISRFGQIAPTLYAPKNFDGKQLSFGLQRMLWGYFKKLVIADRIAAAVIALRGPEHVGVSFFILTVFYAIQIYGDFTGGIDITIGLAQTLGIQLPENFIRPYFSKNIAEYWRRWHISLGEWMKDYIFYPVSVSKPLLQLSKSARKKWKSFGQRLPVYVASIATWFVTGIWHGLTPNFIVWGMLNCFFIVASEECVGLYAKFHGRFHLKEKKWYGGFEILRMFLLMNLIRIVDLFPRVGDYFSKIGSLFTTFNFHVLWDGTMMKLGLSLLDYIILAGGIVLMFTISLIQEKKGSIRELLWRQNALVRYALIFALLVIVLLMGSYGMGYDASAFIYNAF